MAMARLDRITAMLLARGKAPDTPTAVVYRATTPMQRTLIAPLGKLAEEVRAAQLTSPAVIVIGPVVHHREQLRWLERTPLFGKRVLVTRPRPQAARLVRRLEELGADTLTLPAVEIREPVDWSPVDEALAQLAEYRWVVFTSVHGVQSFFGRLLDKGRDLRALRSTQLAVIGPITADALRSFHLQPDLMPTEYCSESLAAALKGRAAGQRILLARADRGRDFLREELARWARVDQVSVYSQVDAVAGESEALARLRSGNIDYITLTSSNIARSLVRALDTTSMDQIKSGSVQLVTISPVTSGTVRELGLPVAAEATTYTTDGLVDALLGLATKMTCDDSG
jgi:uroporphyrinogen III methyltransferase/synthase